jgi:hypothetical protein
MTVKVKKESLHWIGRENTLIHERKKKDEGMFLPLNNGSDGQNIFTIRLEYQLHFNENCVY